MNRTSKWLGRIIRCSPDSPRPRIMHLPGAHLAEFRCSRARLHGLDLFSRDLGHCAFLPIQQAIFSNGLMRWGSSKRTVCTQRHRRWITTSELRLRRRHARIRRVDPRYESLWHFGSSDDGPATTARVKLADAGVATSRERRRSDGDGNGSGRSSPRALAASPGQSHRAAPSAGLARRRSKGDRAATARLGVRVACTARPSRARLDCALSDVQAHAPPA